MESVLDILRCPACVTRLEADDPGRLERFGNWLICQDCQRKYPIREGIPVMLIEEGDKYIHTPMSELGEA